MGLWVGSSEVRECLGAKAGEGWSWPSPGARLVSRTWVRPRLGGTPLYRRHLQLEGGCGQIALVGSQHFAVITWEGDDSVVHAQLRHSQ